MAFPFLPPRNGDPKCDLVDDILAPLWSGYVSGRTGEYVRAPRAHQPQVSQQANLLGWIAGEFLRPRTEEELRRAAEREALAVQRAREGAALAQAQTDAWMQHNAWHAQKATRKAVAVESLERYVRTGAFLTGDGARYDTCMLCGQGELRWAAVTNNMPPQILIEPAYIVFTGSQVPLLNVLAHGQCVSLLRSHWNAFRPTYIKELRARIVEAAQDVANLPYAVIDHILLPCLYEFSTPDARWRSHMHSR
jgi:hypothetical protein